jgi:hypothetical protein
LAADIIGFKACQFSHSSLSNIKINGHYPKP